MPKRLGAPCVGVFPFREETQFCLCKKKPKTTQPKLQRIKLHLSFHYSKQCWFHPLHGLDEVGGALFLAIPRKPCRVCYPLVGKGCRSHSFHVGQNAGAPEQSTSAPQDMGKKEVKSVFLTGLIYRQLKTGIWIS